MTSPAINAAGRSRVGRRALLALLSLSVFVAAIALPTGLHGQPQGKEKKQKAKQTQVRTVTIVTGLWHPWSLAWLPNGDMLVTERNGKLRTVRDNRLDPDPVAGIPAVHAVRLSGPPVHPTATPRRSPRASEARSCACATTEPLRRAIRSKAKRAIGPRFTRWGIATNWD
jgi:hypothetical protein